MEEMVLLSSIWHRFGSEKGYSPACWLDSKSGKEHQKECEFRREWRGGKEVQGYFAPKHVAAKYKEWLVRLLGPYR